MARGIVTCTGVEMNIGDKVRTPDGKVITIQGAAIGVKFFNAEACTLVKPGHEADGPAPHVAGESMAAAASDSDCIVWGS